MRNHDTLYVFVIVLPGKWLDFRVKLGTDTEAPRIFRLSLFQPLLAPLWLECNRFFCFCQCANSASERNLSACWFRLYLTGNTMSRGAHWSDSRCCLENCQRNFHILFLEPMYACPVLTHCKASKQQTNTGYCTVQHPHWGIRFPTLFDVVSARSRDSSSCAALPVRPPLSS